MSVSKKENDIIGKRIEKARNLKEMTQIQVADYLKIKRANYTSTEIRNPSRFFKDYQILDLAKLFDVSADYLLGLAKEPSIDVEIKYICNTYGLSEKALENLKEFNFIAEKNECFTHIKTINLILSQDTMKIWTLIDRYLNMKIEDDRLVVINDDGKAELSNELKSKSTNISLVDTIEGGILQQLSIELNKLKKKVNEDECKRTRKK